MPQQQAERLMKPRFKVIALYPYCPYDIGDLVEFSDLGTSFHCTTTKQWNVFTEEFEDSINYFSIDVLDTWKHLFQRLEWWEDRTVDEMPGYISYISLTLKEKYGDDDSKIRKYIKVKSWQKHNHGEWFFNGNSFNKLYSYHLPATLEEYTQYVNSLK